MGPDERDTLRLKHPRPPARGPVPEAIGEEAESWDDISIPVYVPPSIKVPPPPAGSRVRHYTTPDTYAEADQRRMEQVVDRALKPVQDRIAALGQELEDHRSWVRANEHEKYNARFAEHQERVEMRLALEKIQRDAATTGEDRRQRSRVLFAAVVGALVAWFFAWLKTAG